jgi:hypothetical protein
VVRPRRPGALPPPSSRGCRTHHGHYCPTNWDATVDPTDPHTAYLTTSTYDPRGEAGQCGDVRDQRRRLSGHTSAVKVATLGDRAEEVQIGGPRGIYDSVVGWALERGGAWDDNLEAWSRNRGYLGDGTRCMRKTDQSLVSLGRRQGKARLPACQGTSSRHFSPLLAVHWPCGGLAKLEKRDGGDDA